LEAVDDVLIGDVSNGGAGVEEVLGVGPQGLILFLLAVGQVVASTFAKRAALEVVDEDAPQELPRVDGVCVDM
jgi:hypothetical protein